MFYIPSHSLLAWAKGEHHGLQLHKENMEWEPWGEMWEDGCWVSSARI